VVVQRKLTLEDYCALPDDQDYEIIEGVLYVAPRARPGHQRISNRFAQILTAEEDRGGGVVVPDADLVVDERGTYVSPDLMFFAGDRYAAVDEGEMIRIVPDLVVEVLSPSTADYDRTTKQETYARIGVRHYWVADAGRKAVTEHMLQEDGAYRTRIVRAPEVFRPEIFPHLDVALARVFR
jgi:Uma2 family endonuclease